MNQSITGPLRADPPAYRTLSIIILCGIILAFALSPIRARAQMILPFHYTFNENGILYEAPSAARSSSPYLWLKSGAELTIENGRGSSIQGTLSSNDAWYTVYAKNATVSTDKGTHPQNLFQLFTRESFKNVSVGIYFDRTADNLDNIKNRNPFNGESVIARYTDNNNYYYAGIRADGYVVIKKKVNGIYKTLATKKILSGTYNAKSNPDLIPNNTWIGLKLTVVNDSKGIPQLSLYTDSAWTGTWKQVLSVSDSNGTALINAGLAGIQSDYADVRFDNFTLTEAGTDNTAATVSSSKTAGDAGSSKPAQNTNSDSYDKTVLADQPAAYFAMNSVSSGHEIDLSGSGLLGTYKGGTPKSATLPNGDAAADFNGSSQYLTVPSNAALSIPKTGKLTWEAWIRPDTLNFPNESDDGYVDFMGKCANYSPTCEWEARMYGAKTSEGRPARISAYVFNPFAGLGSAADWQPRSGSIQEGEWVHVVAEYDTTKTPSECSSKYPGTINIWVDGVQQSFDNHAPTGCMSQYNINPRSGNSPLTIGTMAFDTWFNGAIGKVAIYDHLLSQSQINAHFTAMTGAKPSGSCKDTCTIPLLSSLLK